MKKKIWVMLCIQFKYEMLCVDECREGEMKLTVEWKIKECCLKWFGHVHKRPKHPLYCVLKGSIFKDLEKGETRK